MMADETSITGTTIGALACKEVNIGASDVAAATFTQQSHGAQFGPWAAPDRPRLQ